MRVLQDWTKVFERAESAEKLDRLLEPTINLFDRPLPCQPSPEQTELISFIGFIGRSAQSFGEIRVKEMHLNFELMSMSITWFGKVGVVFLKISVLLTTLYFRITTHSLLKRRTTGSRSFWSK